MIRNDLIINRQLRDKLLRGQVVGSRGSVAINKTAARGLI